MSSTGGTPPRQGTRGRPRGPRLLGAADLAAALRLAADWEAARAAGQKSQAAFLRDRFADPRVAGRMRAVLVAGLKAQREPPM